MTTNLDLPTIGPEHLPTDFVPFEEAMGPGVDLRKEATAAWNRGDKDRTETLLHAALEEGLPPIYVAGALELLGEIHLGRGELQEGIACLLRCLVTRPLTAGTAHQAAVRLEIIYEAAGRAAEASQVARVSGATATPGVVLSYEYAEKLRALVDPTRKQPEPEAVLSASEMSVEELIEALGAPKRHEGQGLSVADWERRKEVLAALGQSGDKRALDVLLESLDGEDAPQAAEAVGYLGDPAAIPSLAAHLSDDYERREAALALARIDHPDIVGPLTKVLEQGAGFFKAWNVNESAAAERFAMVAAAVDRLARE